MLCMLLVLPVGWFVLELTHSHPPPAPLTISMTQSNGPLRVFPGLTGVFFILPDGSLWRWGWAWGQTFGSRFSRASVPEQVGTNCDWAQAHAGDNQCVALRTNGTLWEWGFCGTNLWTSQPAPVDGQDWVGIGGGNGHSVALKRDGTIWAWGDNSTSQLGNVGPSQSKPIQVGTDHDWASINRGYSGYSTCGLKTNGTLWVWGRVGGWINATYPSPVQICSDTNWIDFVSHDDLILNRAGQVWTPLYRTTPNPATPSAASFALYLTNWVAGHFAQAFAGPSTEPCQTLFQVRPDGTLFMAPISLARSSSHYALGNWRQFGKRSDWVSIWGSGSTVIGLTADGTLWAWGEDLSHEKGPDFHAKVALLKEKYKKVLRLKTWPLSTLVYSGIITEPRPLMRLQKAQAQSTNSSR